MELVTEGAEPTVDYDRIFDASNHVLLPGLINTHHHFYQTLTRALPRALNKKLFPWLGSLYPVWANLDDDAIYAATQLSIAELLLSGCTTTADHHYVFSSAIPHAIDVQAQAASKMGARVTLTRGSMSLGESSGGAPPDRIVESEATILSEGARLIREYHDSTSESHCCIALAPCSPFSVTPELMQETAASAKEHDVLLHTHLGETEDENAFCLSRYNKRPLDYLGDVGWLNDRVWLAHGIHFTDEEIARLAKAGTSVCHCPTSNMLLASGHFRANDMQRAGVCAGLGVDGSASNDGSNMIQEARQAMLLQKLHYGADQFTHLSALHMATRGGAELLKRPELGQLRVGNQADLALFSLNEPRFSGYTDPIAALLLCGAHQADYVMVGGQWRVREGALVDNDISEIISRHQTAARRVVQQCLQC